MSLRRCSNGQSRLFFEPFQFHLQPTDVLVQLGQEQINSEVGRKFTYILVDIALKLAQYRANQKPRN